MAMACGPEVIYRHKIAWPFVVSMLIRHMALDPGQESNLFFWLVTSRRPQKNQKLVSAREQQASLLFIVRVFSKVLSTAKSVILISFAF